YLSDWWQSAEPPFNVTITPKGNGWQVIVKNDTDHAVKTSQLVIEGRVIALGEVAAESTQTFNVTRDQGTDLRTFVQQHGGNFANVAQQRQHAFGASTGGRLSDTPTAAMTASFVTQLRHSQNYNESFVAPPGLDLSRTV